MVPSSNAHSASGQADALRIRGLTKAFAAHQVLKGIDLDLPAGRVTALMGANGAGKSTLVRILSGVHQADQGSLSWGRQPVSLHSPAAAVSAGVVTVHQIINDNVVQTLSVADNLLLDRLCAGSIAPLLSERRMHEQAQPLADAVGLQVDLSTPVAQLSQADKQRVAIARAMAHKPRMLILDEPTSSLSDAEAERLFQLVEQLRAQGTGILYITHRLNDIRRLADRIAALRDGVIVDEQDSDPDVGRAVQAMLGHAVGEVGHTVRREQQQVARFEQARLSASARPFDLSLRRGEITVLTGLLSSGANKVLEALYGLTPLQAGAMRLNDQPWQPASPAAAIAGGVFMVQEERGNNGVIPSFSILHNLTLPFLRQIGLPALWSSRPEREHGERVLAQTGTVYQHADQQLTKLSGGNQQKVMLARWLQMPCEVLLLAEPFQGVDIGARRDIARLLRDSSDQRATLVLCTDLEEALELADRLLVFNHDHLVGEHWLDELDIEMVIRQISALPQSA
ncbi:sugar ABC transporter ATP-binding protein [Pokkaliibacter sp. MBI-7]|uniref:sugar ABC transporter ATP-binding protein n=1 Tax=Pokkaliibacter sp. MBI-7 TaxID=3040600 RepID=UPI002448DE06|nr:sugar ABC transporter ATP-binding protein [Pokkaliibacter sp. MBI-7]MDH2431824.1 sugar ABC transporter ATP-binding protein [Pokkaliibacter sp. MBI-7]